MGLRRLLTERLVEFLTQPLARYERRGWNDLSALRRHVRKGDVLLVEGSQRVSAVIKVLTQSSWSHSALYVGDELLRHDPRLRDQAVACFGDEAGYLVLEAQMEGVVASPLSKYADHNIRLCRPHNLKPDDLKRIMEESVRTLGWKYDLRNIVDLARYLFPVSLVPRRLRRTALHFGSGTPTEVICSSHIASLFHAVGFPVNPVVEFPDGFDGATPRRQGLLRWVFGYESGCYTGLFRKRHPTLITPRDFDLSPYFEVVKFNVIADRRFDYARIRWVEEVPAGTPPPEAQTPPAPGQASSA